MRVVRNGAVIATSPPITPTDDPTTPIVEGIVDVNHVGAGDCWDMTPDIRPGDKIRATDSQNRSLEITVANVRAGVATNPAPGVIDVHGTAQDLGGNPLPLGQIQHRLIKAKRAPSFDNGRREFVSAMTARCPTTGPARSRGPPTTKGSAHPTLLAHLPGDTAVAGIGAGPTEVLNVGTVAVGGVATQVFTITLSATSGQRWVTAWVRTGAHDFAAVNDFATGVIVVP